MLDSAVTFFKLGKNDKILRSFDETISLTVHSFVREENSSSVTTAVPSNPSAVILSTASSSAFVTVNPSDSMPRHTSKAMRDDACWTERKLQSASDDRTTSTSKGKVTANSMHAIPDFALARLFIMALVGKYKVLVCFYVILCHQANEIRRITSS